MVSRGLEGACRSESMKSRHGGTEGKKTFMVERYSKEYKIVQLESSLPKQYNHIWTEAERDRALYVIVR